MTSLFYDDMLGNHIYCAFIFTFFCIVVSENFSFCIWSYQEQIYILKIFFLHMILSNTNDF